MTEFLNAFYGEEAAKYIREYINYIEYKTEKAYHLYCFNWPYQNGFYSLFERKKIDKLWNDAEKAAKTDEQLERVQRSRLSWRYYKSCMYLDEFNPITRIRENKKFYNDLVRLGVTQLKEGSTLVDNPDYFAGPTSWSVKR
ncbi:hypothetical protein SDC9_192332 [bioreactor metagenome]|uniref:Uncharacterized protein n=1 Tax=bioreactor metagenome TaxID=1076179 RepID=A0A645I0G7_9ZZZZ